MGQYLALGLTHRIAASIEEIRKAKITNEELCQEMQQSFSVGMELYDEKETDTNLVFSLKNEIMETDLISFLKELYPLVYDAEAMKEYEDVLKTLHSTPPTKWMAAANQKSNFAFQIDDYIRIIRLSKPFRPEIRLKFSSVILKLGYGKIVTEGISDFAYLFNHCFHETFKKHRIAKAVRAYLTD